MIQPPDNIKKMPTALWMAVVLSSVPLSVFASTSTWEGTGSSDLNTSTNWSPVGVPTTTTDATFNSTISGINLAPTATTTNFSVSTFAFPNSASAFGFTLSNITLAFSGSGITGTNTNTTITANNTNNGSTLAGDQISFNNASSNSSGAAIIHANNTATSTTGTLGVIGTDQIHSANPFSVATGGQLIATNSGTNSSNALSLQRISHVNSNQLDCGSTLTLSNNVTISLSSSGVNNNTVTGNNNRVGYVANMPLSVTGALNAGDGCSLSFTNSGTDNSGGTGTNRVGYAAVTNMTLGNSATFGNNATITISNTGTNASSGSNNRTGFTVSQFIIQQGFTAGTNLNFTLTNLGTDNSTGSTGNLVGYLNNTQSKFHTKLTAGDNATFSFSNTGINGSTGHGNSTGVIQGGHVQITGATSVGNTMNFTMTNAGTYTGSGTGSNLVGVTVGAQLQELSSFTALANATIVISNTGTDSSTGSGSNQVGVIAGDQFTANSVSLGNSATITISNSGTNSSNGTGSQTGSLQTNRQFAVSGFTAGTSLNFSATNTGIDHSTGAVTNTIGYIGSSQIQFSGTTTIGNNASITVSNSGTSTNASSLSSVGVVANQFGCSNPFTAGTNFTMTATNSGVKAGSSATVGQCSSQLFFSNSCTLSSGSTLSAANNNAGTVTGSQIWFQSGLTLTSGTATLQASNQGTLSGHGIYVQGVALGGDFDIILTNSSLYVATSSSSFKVGALNGDSTSTAQVNVPFTISTDTAVTATFAGVISNYPSVASSLIKTGAGTQILSGTNTYTGSTQVNGGILSIGSIGPLTGTSLLSFGGGTLSASSSFTLPSTLPITVSSTGALSAGGGVTLTVQSLISGSGTLTFSGGGTFPVSGNNSSFAGNMTVTGSSILSVGATNNLGTDSASYQLLLNGATLATTGNITSLRALSIAGTNTIDVGSSTVSFTGTGTVSSGSFLTKAGVGTLSVLPSSAESGNAFTLDISAGNMISNTHFLAKAAITVAASSTMEFDQTSSGTFSGSVGGAGAVSIVGSGPLTFSPSSSTYTGGTLVYGSVIIGSDVFGSSSGILYGEGGSVESTSTFSMSRNVDLVGDLTFSTDSDTELTLSGVISNSGALFKAGKGILILTNTSTYTGKTYVNAGVLQVDGNITSSPDPIVASGALLSGVGTVGTTLVSGTIKGGNPSGTLTVDGNLTLEENSSFGMLIVPGSSSLVTVDGDVTIDPSSSVVIAFYPGTYNNTSTVILSGDSITGTFSGVDVNTIAANFLTANLMYTDTEVILSLKERDIDTHALGGNAMQVGEALDGAIAFNRSKVFYTVEPGPTVTASPTPQLKDVLESLLPFMEDSKITYALNQLHPAQLKGMTISQENNAVRVRESLSQRILNDINAENCKPSNSHHETNTPCCEKNKKTMTAWISPIGDTLKQNNVNNSYGPLTGYRTNTGGVVTGIDALFAEAFYAGALGGYTDSHLHFEDGKGKGDISSGYAGVYFSVIGSGSIGKMFYANTSVIGSWSKYRVDRHIEYGTVNLTAKHSHGGNQILSHFDTGLNFNWFGFTVRPFDSFDYMSQTERGYQEDNAGEWELTVQRKNATMIRNELGLQFAKCLCFCSSKWIFSPKISWVREIRIKGQTFNVNFTQGGSPFVIHGYFPDRSLFVPGISLTGFMLEDALVFDLYYNGEFTGGYSSNSIGGQIGYSF